MNKHTPGPWRFEQGSRHDDLKMLIGGNGEEICFFGNEERYEQTAGFEPEEADMHLITAAPDLLTELECVVADLFYQIESRHGAEVASKYPSILSARAVIAKAKGSI